MIRLNMFKQAKPREFNLQPRYYDERKERLDKLKAKYEDKENAQFDRELYRDHLRSSWSMRRESRRNFQNWRVLLIFGLIIAMIYWIFK